MPEEARGLQLTSCFLLLISRLFLSSSWAQEAVPLPSREEPVNITAEHLEYFKEQDRFIAEGTVVVIQGPLRLTADRAELDNQNRQVQASGRVVLFDGENRLTAEQLKFNLNTEEGTVNHGMLFVEKDHYYLQAERMEKLGGDRYRFETGSITTCDFGEGRSPLWRFRARAARARLGHYLVARDVTFYIKDVPLFYLPYLILPIKTARQTGFLVPRLGYNTKEGLKINEDFFWVIAPNQDATLSLDYRSARGVGGGLEYRYRLSKESEGSLETHYFYDRIKERQRAEGEFKHRQVFTEDLQVRLDVHLVNNIGQFRDLSEVTEQRISQALESSFILYRRWDNQYLYLLARYTQDLLAENETTLQRLPEVGYRLQPYPIGALPLYFRLEATLTHFWREEELLVPGQPEENKIRAERLDLFPRLEGKVKLGGMVITPRAGFRETWYSRGLSSDSSVHRNLAVFDTRVHTDWYRSYPAPDSGRLIHWIEPDLIYEYVPKVNQSDLPKFDEVDELHRKNLLTYSLTNRLAGHFHEKGKETPQRRELVLLKLTQSYDVREKRRQEDQGPSRPFSNLRAEVTVRPLPSTQFDIDSFYNLYERATVSLNTDLKIRVSPWILFSAGQRFTREGTLLPRGDAENPLSQPEEPFWYTSTAPLIRFYTGYLRLDLPMGLSLASRAYYNAQDRHFAEISYGLQYDGPCWALAVSYLDLPDKNQLSFLITLKAAGSTRSKAFVDLFKPQP